jgi:hypothetical protein
MSGIDSNGQKTPLNRSDAKNEPKATIKAVCSSSQTADMKNPAHVPPIP